MAQAGITDLPSEILLKILEDSTFPTKGLYNLALLSRRLNLIALPIYFSRNGVNLQAKCAKLSPPESHHSFLELERHFADAPANEAFIARLSYVKKVSLHLASIEGCGYSARGGDAILEAWASQFRSLLDRIIETGCTSLTVISGTQLTKTYELQEVQGSGVLRYLPRVIGQLLVRPDPRLGFRRNPEQGTDEAWLSMPPFCSRSQLTSLVIDSVTLVVPPGLHWTLAALQHSPITSLAIRMALVPSQIWRTVLPAIASAALNLTTVSITELDVSGEYWNSLDETLALAFLASLTALTAIELTHLPHPWRPGPCKASRGAFRHLLTLRAPATVVAHILSRTDSVPAIRAICVLWRAPRHDRLKTLIALMSIITRTLAARGLTPRLSLWIESLGAGGDDDTSVLRKIGSVQPVEHIHFEGAHPPVDPTPRPFIGSFVAMFSGVSRVSLTTRGAHSDATVCCVSCAKSERPRF
ncbi:hypothetical protein B0H19DRAFT_1079175 [Mycena capillaripes]|nr:hypothetical protein B0H19DRAFT_1079175 [Mycena capillaripes]